MIIRSNPLLAKMLYAKITQPSKYNYYNTVITHQNKHNSNVCINGR